MIKDKDRIIPTEETEKARDKYRPDRDPVLPEQLDDISVLQGLDTPVDLKFRPITGLVGGGKK